MVWLLTMKQIDMRKMLNKKNMTQAEMARQLNMSPQRVCDIFSGRLKGWKYRNRIARYFEVPEEILFPENIDKHKSCQA